MNFWLPVSGNFGSIFNYGLLFLCFFMVSSQNEKLHKRVILMADGTGKTTRRLFYEGNVGSIAKNLAPLQNQKKPSQLGKLIIFIRKKMTYKDKKYSVKMQKYYFCNGTALTHENRYFTKR
ncbi:MAG: hypothetical protein ACYDEF_10735 [Methanosarcina sp.]